MTLLPRPVWTAPPTSLKSLDDPLLRGEATRVAAVNVQKQKS